MNFAALNTYGEAPDQAFEVFCAQLFEHWVRATYQDKVKRFAVVNGAGGDGGVEAYAELKTGEVVALQAKWFREPLEETQFKQIRKSVEMAQRVRPRLSRYIVCVPRDLQSSKIGRGDKLVRHPEDQRVEDLLTELEGLYPDVKVEFWTEHQLQELLLLPENDGINRFWFTKEELSPTTLTQQFARAKAGWLRERYSPDLHTYGLIQHEINALLLTPAYRRAAHQQVSELLNLLDEAAQLLTSFGQLAGAPAAVNTLAEEVKHYLLAHHGQLQLVAQALLTADDQLTMPAIPLVELWPLSAELADGSFSNLVLPVVPRLQQVLHLLAEANLPAYATRVLTGQQPHNLLVFGRPSTGKTHGLARAVDQRLTEGYPALLVSARRAPAPNWHALLTYALGGFMDWTDAQLFTALEALAVRADVRRARAATVGAVLQDEPTRVLIGLDGLDEAPDLLPWQERVRELRELLRTYPRLRFVVTSRAYSANLNPSGLDVDEAINRRLDLPLEGDVPLVELATRYLHHYHINYSSLPWLPEAFHDALAIRLFAQQYQNQDLATLTEPVTTGLNGLLHYKIGQLETEFADMPQLAFPASLHLAQLGLLSVCRRLQTQPSLEHDALCEHLVTDLRSRVNLNQATLLLDGYANHGLILQQEEPGATRLAPPTRRVSLAYQQPLVDYLLASEATEYICQSGDKRVPASLRGRRDPNALYLTATALLSDYQILVGEDGYWVEDLSAESLADLQYAALANAPAVVVAGYLPKAIARFRQGMRERNTVLEEFVLPNAYRTDVEIVRPLVHDVLGSFPSVFARDLFWSGPPALEDSRERNVGQLLGEQQLRDYDAATGLPLLFAWSLATVNNTYREHARRELTHWGSTNPAAFVQLLELVFEVGDPQMQQDLAIIMLGVTSLLTQPSAGGQQLAAWILRTIFAPDRIPRLLNSVVRAHARAAVERAVALGDCSDEAAGPARPPYPTDSTLLPLMLSDAKELSAKRAGYWQSDERFPIVHDLAWYVLKDSYEGFLDLAVAGRSRQEAQGYTLLADYEQQYQQSIGAYEFAMSAALAYIASLGYDRTTGPGATEKTHGRISKTSTLEEKYTWLAVHHLQGYLADRLPFGRFSTTPQLVRNYRDFLPIVNPATSLAGTTLAPVTWYVPTELAPEIPAGIDEDLVARLREWVLRLDEPDFATWLRLPGFGPAAAAAESTQRAWLPLSAHIRLPEREGRGTTELNLCCVWLSQADWQAIQSSYAGNLGQFVKDNFHAFDDLNSWQARPAGDTYASVKDVILGHSVEEEENNTTLYGPDEQEWIAYHTITRVLEDSIEGGEVEYLVPSQLVRQHLGIVDTNRQAFLTPTGVTVAAYQELNENFDPAQEFLVVDRQQFLAVSVQHQLQPFWLVSQFQKTSVEFAQQHPNGHAQNIRYWLVWEEDGLLHTQLYYRNWFKGQREDRVDEEGEEVGPAA